MPIKSPTEIIINYNNYSYHSKEINSNPNKPGVTAVFAIPQFTTRSKKNRRSSRQTIKFWHVLFDSCSDGDIVFKHKNAKSRFPIKRRDYPMRWQTSNGIFETNKVASIDLVFPETIINSLCHMISHWGLPDTTSKSSIVRQFNHHGFFLVCLFPKACTPFERH